MRSANAAALRAVTLAGAVIGAGPAQARQLDTQNTIPRAQEGGVCTTPYPTNVHFGVPGRTIGCPSEEGGPERRRALGDPDDD